MNEWRIVLCCKLKCVPQKDMLTFWPMVSVNVTLFGNVINYDRVIVGQGWRQTLNTIWVTSLWKEGNLGSGTHENNAMWRQAEVGVMCLQAKDCWPPPFFLRALHRNHPCQWPDIRPLAPELGWNTFPLFQTPSLVVRCYGSPRKLIHLREKNLVYDIRKQGHLVKLAWCWHSPWPPAPP